MRIFVAGATGAVGRPLVPALIAAGHSVVGHTRTPAKTEAIKRMGAEPVVVDGLDAAAIRAAVTSTKPDVVIDEMTDRAVNRRRRRMVVVPACRRCGFRDRHGDRARQGRQHLQHRGRSTRPGQGMASRACRNAGRQAAASCTGLVRPSLGRRTYGFDDATKDRS